MRIGRRCGATEVHLLLSAPFQLVSSSVDSVATQSQLLSTLPESSFFRFLTDNSPLESNSLLPHCFYFGTAGKGIRSPRIPILVDGIVVPVVVDTGAEVSMLSDDAMQKLFPNGYWEEESIPDNELSVMQTEDPDLGPVAEWLRNQETPTFDDLRSYSLTTRKLWDLVPMVHLLNDVLVFKPNDDASIKLVVPLALRKQLFDACHSGPLAAHLGSFRMTQELKSQYFWIGLRQDVENWCKQCPICAKGRGPPPRRHGRLQKVLTGAPLDIVAIDILSGLPATQDGSKYILVLTDYFTKWSEAYPLLDAEASTCMRAIYNNFCSRFGLPHQLHSDMGKNFESNLFKELCELTGTYKSHMSPFHPISDGQSEHINRTLLQMLRATAQDNPETWPTRLPTLMAAYRMTTHSHGRYTKLRHVW